MDGNQTVYESPIYPPKYVHAETNFSGNRVVTQTRQQQAPVDRQEKLRRTQVVVFLAFAILLSLAVAAISLIFVHDKKFRDNLDELNQQLEGLEKRFDDQAHEYQALNVELNDTTDLLLKSIRLTNSRQILHEIAHEQSLDIRLANGSTTYGRVEIFYNGVWGTICDDSWDGNDAVVVCRMLGLRFFFAIARSGAYYGQGTGPIWLDDVGCEGSETSLWKCRKSYWGINNCNHGEDASVSCH